MMLYPLLKGQRSSDSAAVVHRPHPVNRELPVRELGVHENDDGMQASGRGCPVSGANACSMSKS